MRLHYCNSLHWVTLKFHLERLQELQNKDARQITKTTLREHNILPVLKKVDWFPDEMKNKFKIARIVYKCICCNCSSPYCLEHHINKYKTPKVLR